MIMTKSMTPAACRSKAVPRLLVLFTHKFNFGEQIQFGLWNH